MFVNSFPLVLILIDTEQQKFAHHREIHKDSFLQNHQNQESASLFHLASELTIRATGSQSWVADIEQRERLRLNSIAKAGRAVPVEGGKAAARRIIQSFPPCDVRVDPIH